MMANLMEDLDVEYAYQFSITIIAVNWKTIIVKKVIIKVKIVIKLSIISIDVIEDVIIIHFKIQYLQILNLYHHHIN